MIKVFSSKVGDEELCQISETIDNQWLGAGPKVKYFEEIFKNKINSELFLMIDNASNGLFLACKLLNLPKNSEVILPSFTYVACANAVSMAGYTPIFCDVEYDSQNITASLIEPLINNNTKAIMIVHYAGLPVVIEPILQFKIPIIEDAAHAVNSIYNGKHCGTFGEIGVFSFDPTKNIAMGEGGGITLKSNNLYEKAKKYRLSGLGESAFDSSHKEKKWWEQDIEDIFIKMMPSDVNAGIGIAQLEKLLPLQMRRKYIWDIYQKELKDIEQILLPTDIIQNANIKHSYFTFFIRTKYRDALASYLYNQGVYTTLRFFPIHLTTFYKVNKRLVNTEKLNDTGLNIPLHPAMTEDDIGLVLSSIKKFFKKNSYR